MAALYWGPEVDRAVPQERGHHSAHCDQIGDQLTRLNIPKLRLLQQGVTGAPFEAPSEVVARLGAVQAQDYPSALWAVGLRTRDGTRADVERAIAAREIVRTWPMRGTLHFVPAADAAWMLALLTPRIVAGMAS